MSNGAAHCCADCGTAAPGRHCPACGQKTVLDRSLGAMVSSLIHDVTHFDSRLLLTLPLLAFQPGVLTRRYIDGFRTRYIGPNVVFLGTAFVMFLSFNLLPDPATPPPCNSAATSAVQRAGVAIRHDLEQMGPELIPLLPATSPAGIPPAVAWLEGHIPKALLARLESALENPAMAIQKVKTKAYKLGFLLVPLSLPALWLLVGRRPGVLPYDLVVFALYSIGFMSLLLTFVTLVAGLGIFAWPFYVAILLLFPPLHFYIHLRDGFNLTAVEAAWRTAALLVVAVFSLLTFLLLVLAWGLFG